MPGTPEEFLKAMHSGHACAARWDQPGAIQHFTRALAINSASIAARVNLGLAQLLDGKSSAAAATLEPLTRAEPVSVQVLYLCGLALLKDGRAEDALPLLGRASEASPADASLLFQYGVALQEAKKAEEAAAVYRRVMALERFHITAPFRLGRLERMAGRETEADRLLVVSERNRTVLGADAADREARGLNRYTKPLDPPSAWQPKPAPDGEIRFVEVTQEWGARISTDPARPQSDTPIAIIDVDRDFQPELLFASGGAWRLWRFDGERFEASAKPIEAPVISGLTSVVAGDFDNDGLEDAYWVGSPRGLLLRQVAPGSFVDFTARAGLDSLGASAAVAMDAEHDGDLDLVVTQSESAIGLWRNDGSCTFSDQTDSLRIPPDDSPHFSRDRTRVVAVGEFNDDDSTDLLVSGGMGGRVLLNAGSYDFASPQMPAQDVVVCCGGPALGLHDLDNDGRLDAAVTGVASGSLFRHHLRFVSDSAVKQLDFDVPADEDSRDLPCVDMRATEPPTLNAKMTIEGLSGMEFFDYDGDGFPDVLVHRLSSLRLWRNLGAAGWREVTDEVGLSASRDSRPWCPFSNALVACDFDGDGDLDILWHGQDGSLRFLRSEGSRAALALRLSLEGTKTNRSAIGARVDIRAGNARIFRNVTSPTMTIGVGEFEKLDLVKVLWTNGATDAFTDVPVDRPLHVVETTVTLGSCPHLYVWNNGGFRFVTDILGNSPLGLPYAPGKYIPADTSEIVWLGDEAGVTIAEGRIGGDALAPFRADAKVEPVARLRRTPGSDGAMSGSIANRESPIGNPHQPVAVARGSDLRRFVVVEITDELRELLYLDEAKLLVVDHPQDLEVHPNDKVIPPPFPPSEVWAVRAARWPMHAIDHTGKDVASRLAEVDEVKVGPRKLRPPQFKGLAETATLELDFGAIDVSASNVLVMNGWLHWGGAGSNIAAAQNPQLGNPFPSLEVMTEAGVWVPVDVVVGAPAGKTKTILVDLTGKLPKGSQRLRLSWGLELYWDRIALAQRAVNHAVRELRPSDATLYYHGVPRMTRESPDRPFVPKYDELLDSPPWRLIPEGYCTRYGDVLDLLGSTDDRYVVMNCGDACRIHFDVTELPATPDGWMRQFFLFTDGWDKDMDHNVFTGSTVDPLPVHGQDDQSYGREQIRLPDSHWSFEMNTRWVPRDGLHETHEP